MHEYPEPGMSMRSANTLSSAESDASRLCRRADRLVRSPWMRSSRRSACRS